MGVYNPEQAMSLLFSDIMTNSVRTTVEHVDLRWIAGKAQHIACTFSSAQ